MNFSLNNRLPTAYRPENEIVSARLASLDGALDWAAAAAQAKPWVQAVRDNPPPFWAMESLLREYPLSSAEGLALMRLAEALLRIPDAATRDALIRDKIAQGNWQQHLGQSPSLFVTAAAWGLLLTGRLVATHSDSGLTHTLKRTLAPPSWPRPTCSAYLRTTKARPSCFSRPWPGAKP